MFLPDVSSHHHVKDSQKFISWDHVIIVKVVHLECNWKRNHVVIKYNKKILNLWTGYDESIHRQYERNDSSRHFKNYPLMDMMSLFCLRFTYLWNTSRHRVELIEWNFVPIMHAYLFHRCSHYIKLFIISYIYNKLQFSTVIKFFYHLMLIFKKFSFLFFLFLLNYLLFFWFRLFNQLVLLVITIFLHL